MIKSERSVHPVFDENGLVVCYMNVETTYKNGKKKTRKRCAAKF